MNWPRVSVIVVSRDRPSDLALCLIGLAQIDYPEFEVIVIANARSASGIGDHPVKLVPFEAANISAARNAGIAEAAGEIVAFIDDDAVPVPGWLKHLIFPMIDTDIAATGGFVVGRNGFSYQWTSRHILPDGQAVPFDLEKGPPDGAVIKTEGTNMALRADVARAFGFDEAFAFYLDETDLNMRLAKAGHRTQIVPRAVVHHGYAASARRTSARVPRDLTQIAASMAVFQRKHGAPDPKPERARQRSRLLRHMVAGDLMPGDVRRLLKGFDQGWAEGMERPLEDSSLTSANADFRPYSNAFGEEVVLHGRFWQRQALMEKARGHVSMGKRVSVFMHSATSLRHTLRFEQPGVWVQRGGQFGASDRAGPAVQLWRTKRRIAEELQQRNNSWCFPETGEQFVNPVNSSS